MLAFRTARKQIDLNPIPESGLTGYIVVGTSRLQLFCLVVGCLNWDIEKEKRLE